MKVIVEGTEYECIQFDSGCEPVDIRDNPTTGRPLWKLSVRTEIDLGSRVSVRIDSTNVVYTGVAEVTSYREVVDIEGYSRPVTYLTGISELEATCVDIQV